MKHSLNLTAASRVYLMEPQWNPNIEEQILSRVHRLGQQRPVTTARLIVEGTIEDVRVTAQCHFSPQERIKLISIQHVINVQSRKTQLADLLLSQDKNASAEGNRGRLQCLRDLLN